MTRNSDDRWVSLRGPNRWVPFVVMSPFLRALMVVYGLNLIALAPRLGLPLVWSIAIMICAAVGVSVLPLAIIWLVYPYSFLNPASSTIRARRRSAQYSNITSAQLLVSVSKTRRVLNLLLKTDTGLRALVLIRDARRCTLDPEVAVLAEEMIRFSKIAIPVSIHDPLGKFARYNFPNNVTLDEALEFVRHPPDFLDDLPIRQRRSAGF
ncbi:hypothetical protein E3O44_06230 [Cryobacterium algoricola]|uniref:Uncharacterized protein n=1 Tax=Cryobacterium algoricola TaxID=1259183 RepID=A0ABY2IEN9_9MICO|nr:hypothetical protein [Cryobacterium algoricola]TFB88264.1 hypothetical protein E3O44_06230 [Cryobacterium algoricola]